MMVRLRTRMLLGAVACGLGVGAALGVGPAVAADSTDTLAIGDSVMLGAKWELRDRGIRVDAETSRQAQAGLTTLRSKEATLPSDVIVHLGTNGPFPREVCERIIRTAGPDRVVHLVTIAAPRWWVRKNNTTIRVCAASFPADRVRVIDWAAATRKNPGWLYSDGIHLRPEGARGYARLIARSLAERK